MSLHAPALDVQALDPGVRDLVVALHAAGWPTTDSGDGASRPPADDVLPFAHVVVPVADPSRLVVEANRMLFWLRASSWPTWIVEASYAPHDGEALLLLREAAPDEVAP